MENIIPSPATARRPGARLIAAWMWSSSENTHPILLQTVRPKVCTKLCVPTRCMKCDHQRFVDGFASRETFSAAATRRTLTAFNQILEQLRLKPLRNDEPIQTVALAVSFCPRTCVTFWVRDCSENGLDR